MTLCQRNNCTSTSRTYVWSSSLGVCSPSPSLAPSRRRCWGRPPSSWWCDTPSTASSPPTPGKLPIPWQNPDSTARHVSNFVYWAESLTVLFTGSEGHRGGVQRRPERLLPTHLCWVCSLLMFNFHHYDLSDSKLKYCLLDIVHTRFLCLHSS